ncbi:hypothetical protein DQ04_00921050 [Trypanosoma grayi]|uniref:hypothetical protein n=1 Tax=Trypanosoma grayi TaxID=71804 RepID=UPI0004F4103D|nr:hypothetical protein DQ04_00921050 [Trypanosoma grayi]KEG13571.1 hypothetical protein DQ04_00921050 [Trypanosoma grayi]
MFKIQVVSSGQSETYLLATVILMKTLKASAGPDSSIGMPEIKALIDSLVSSGHLEKPPRPENLIIEALPLLLQLTEPAKGAVRIAVSAAAQQLTSPQLHDLLSHLLFITAEESSVRRWFGIPNALGDFSMWCYELFVQAALLSEIPFGKDDRDAVMKSALHKFGEGASRLHEALATIKEESCIQILLGTVGEYYPFLASNVLADPRPLVDAVATLAFESDGGTRTLALKTLVSIAVTEEKRFIDNRVEKWYKEKRLWRPHLIAFFGNLIVSSPVNSYASFPTMTTFLLRALDPHNPNRDEHDSCVVPVTQVIRVAVNCLPNVSFQQHLQYLAVGNTDGIVQVINLKTTGIVASFVSHPEAILCVSYSSNTSSHDIAVLSEKMETVKIWRASRTANVLSAIFAGHMTEFRLRFTVDIPSFDRNLSISCERFLLINKCRLRWLSPHCVELSSPWHDRIQLAVQ